MSLSKNIVQDLELIKTIEPSECIPLYHYAFQPKTLFGKKVIEQVANYYTTDKEFLKDTQTLLTNFVPLPLKNEYQCDIMQIWDEIKNDTGFREKYHYIDWPMWEYLNKSDIFLQLMSVYNLAAPVVSLFIPVIILIIPFFVIQMKGLHITFHDYIEVLKEIAANHAIGKLFTKFHSVKLDEKIYILLSAAFYLFSIYQNVLTCLRFHQNMVKIHQYLEQIKNYISNTEQQMQNLLCYTSKLSSYKQFNNVLQEKLHVLYQFKKKLDIISAYKFSYKKVGEFGHVLKQFYDLYNDEQYNESFLYSFGFHGYIDIIEGLHTNIKENHICLAKFTSGKKAKHGKKKDITSFKKAYYPTLIHNQPIKNSITFDKNMVVTGPNASGKTTTLKTTLVNIIITQQFGCGFYKDATIEPYKHIHCYLNIPDTSGRDSLFQAEARRCKEIIDCIEKHSLKERHFCVFDELYSGTNPDEAVSSAHAFMKYIMKHKNVDCFLTTHFFDLCEKLGERQDIKNFHMETIKQNDSFIYTYLLKEGISKVRGGVKVLLDMKYPQEIIDDSMKK